MKSRLLALAGALLPALAAVSADNPVLEVQGAAISTRTISLGGAPTACTILVFTNTTPGTGSVLVNSAGTGVKWDYLVVGGGGAGGAAGGGGGGGGGVKYGEGLSFVTGEKYVITVGAGAARVQTKGGSASVTYDTSNSAGGASTLARNNAVVAKALGGGSGASWNNAPALRRTDVASSGGGSKSAPKAGDAVIFGNPVDGNLGGDYVLNSADGKLKYAAGGGGGGYAGPGLAITNDLKSLAAGRGGEGYPCDITGTREIYGSGGGGAVGTSADDPGYPGGAGGTNAGTGSSRTSCPGDAYDELRGTPGHAGRPGYGGGGGAGAWPASGSGRAYGGAGGSGTVIIRIRAACHVIYRWPTGHGWGAGEVDAGLLGDDGELGWKGRMPRFADSETYFDAAGDWRAELTDGVTLAIPGVTRFCPKSGVGSVGACANSRLTISELRLCESGSGLAELRAEEANGLTEVANPLNVFNGRVRFVAASGGTLSTASGVTFGGRAKSEVRLREGGIWRTGRVTFGSQADRGTASVSVVSDGGEIVLSADASYCGDGPFVHTNSTYRVTAGRRVVLGDDTRLEFFGGIVTGGIWAVGTTGTRNALEFGGGAVFAPDTFDFATVNGAAGELDFRSGARMNCAGTLIVGSVGYGALVVDGGVVSAVGSVRVGSKSRLELRGGGVIVASNVTGSDGATITSDGGILRSVGEPGPGTGGFLAHIPPISCAKDGLTIDTAGRDSVVKASFVKAADGSAGLLAKVGEGTLEYADGACEVGALRVDGGVFRLGEKAAIDPGCALEVNGGGTFSTAGAATGVTVASLAVNGGTIELDATDAIVVSGALTLANPKVRFTTPPDKDTTNTVLTVSGGVSPEVLKAWSEAQVANDLGHGRGANFIAVEEGGATRLKVAVFEAPRTVWTGAVDGNWGNAGNWTGGVPVAGVFASFTASEPGTTAIEVPDGAAALMLEISGASYTFEGGTLTLRDGSRPPCVDAAEGTTNVISTALVCAEFAKEGDGVVVLTGENSIAGDVIAKKGVLRLGDTLALGESGLVVLAGGTLELAPEVGTLRRRLAIADGGEGVVSVPAHASAALSDPAVTGGTLVKRGAGALEMRFDGAAEISPFAVEEGELALRSGGSRQVRVTVDGTVENGRGEGMSEAVLRLERVALTVGGYSAGRGRAGEFGSRLEMLGSSLTSDGVIELAGEAGGSAANVIAAQDSEIVARGPAPEVNSALDAAFVGGQLVAPAGLTVGSGASGSLEVGAGAVFRALGLRAPSAMSSEFALVFTGGGWDVSSADGDVVVGSGSGAAKVVVRSVGSGEMLGLSVASGRRLTFAPPVRLEGDGGLAVDGGGTVAFESGVFALSSPHLAARDGVLNLSGAGQIASPSIRCGAGTIRGGAFRNAVLQLDSWHAEPLPRLDACTFGGKTHVASSSAEKLTLPCEVRVADCSNMTLDFTQWTVDYAGRVTSMFSMADGHIVASIGGSGLFIMVR